LVVVGTYQLGAVALDQFGNAFSSQPTFTWSVSDTSQGSVTTSGFYTAPLSGSGPFSLSVWASIGSVTVTASSHISLTSNAAPTALPAVNSVLERDLNSASQRDGDADCAAHLICTHLCDYWFLRPAALIILSQVSCTLPPGY
jgi:hypothetical protein